MYVYSCGWMISVRQKELCIDRLENEYFVISGEYLWILYGFDIFFIVLLFIKSKAGKKYRYILKLIANFCF